MRRTTRFVFLATAVAMLGGCQQIAWKPGASSADLDRDTAACEAQYQDETAVRDCLRKRGWSLRLPKQSAGESAEEVEEVEEEVVIPGAVAAPDPAQPAVPMPASGAVAAPPAAASEPTSGTPAPVRRKAVPKPVDPNKPILVQAWWKMGSGADALDADLNTCVETLGPTHRPDLQQRLYTRALIDCMKGKGWFGK